MGTVVEDRKAWQDIVAQKRRLQAESLARLAPREDSLEGEVDGKPVSEESGPVEGSKLVARLARGELTCESLVKSHIEKLVTRNMRYVTKLRKKSC